MQCSADRFNYFFKKVNYLSNFIYLVFFFFILLLVHLRTLKFDENRLVTGSFDHTVKIWNFK